MGVASMLPGQAAGPEQAPEAAPEGKKKKKQKNPGVRVLGGRQVLPVC